MKKLSLYIVIVGFVLVSRVWSQAAGLTAIWDANAEPDISGYTLNWSTNNTVFNQISVGNVTNYVFSPVSPSVTYTFYLTAENTAGLSSDPSTNVAFTTPSLVVAPVIVSQSYNRVGTNVVASLSWLPLSPQYSAKGYYTYVERAGIPFQTNLTSGTNFVWTLAPNFSYKFYVKATNMFGISSSSQAFTITKPTTPKNFSVN